MRSSALSVPKLPQGMARMKNSPQAIRTWLAAVCAYYLLCCQKANYFSASQAVRASRIAALSLSVTEQGCDPTGSHLFL